MKKIKFTPGDTNYRWDFSENSPFLKRSLTVFFKDRKAKAKSLKVKKRYYELFFANEKETYLSRNQHHLPPVLANPDQKYLQEHELSGDFLQIHFSINRLLDHLIISFTADPHSLFSEAERVQTICREENFTIPSIDAFNKLGNWDEFMQLLKSLIDSQGPYKFELMLAAIIQYARLCGG